MDNWIKAKEWINENAPMLAYLYQNKYVGMAYDRFASLPPKQQKQVVLGGFSAVVGIVVLFLFLSYISFWSAASTAKESYAMVTLLQQFQKNQRDKAGQIQHLERNAQLAQPGQFKEHLIVQGRAATISPRMIQVDEKSDGGEGEEGKGAREVKLKQATVTLERVNLMQLKNFLQNVEFGPYNLSVSSIKITNDDKIRGYMKVELGIVAYLFQTEEST